MPNGDETVIPFRGGTPRRPLQRGSDVKLAFALVKELREHFGEAVFCEGQCHVWDGRCWTMMAEADLRTRLHGFDGASLSAQQSRTFNLTRSKIDGALKEARAMLDAPDHFSQAPAGLNCRSGFFRLDASGTISRQAHHPDFRQRFLINADFDGKVREQLPKTSLLSTLVEGCFRGDPDAAEKHALVQELAGAALFGLALSLPAPKATVLLGPSAENGKSQTLKLLQALLPPDMVSAVSPADMAKEQHRALLAGKRLNVSDELGAAITRSEAFKAIVTGDTVSGKVVYAPPFHFQPQALQVFTGNSLPVFRAGMDAGVRRRLQILVFNRVIPLEERIVDLGAAIARHELDLVLGWAAGGAIRLMQTRAFTDTPSGRAALANWITRDDPVRVFMEDRDHVEITGQDSDRVRTKDAYKAFQHWARHEEGLAAVHTPTQTQFTERVGHLNLPDVAIKRHGKLGYRIYGVRIASVSSVTERTRK